MVQKPDPITPFENFCFWFSIGCASFYFTAYNLKIVKDGLKYAYELFGVIVFGVMILAGLLSIRKYLKIFKTLSLVFEKIKAGEDPE